MNNKQLFYIILLFAWIFIFSALCASQMGPMDNLAKLGICVLATIPLAFLFVKKIDEAK